MKELIKLIYGLNDENYIKFSNDYGIYSEEIEKVDNQYNEIETFVNTLTNKEIKEVKEDLINYK
tara:strand:+ start:331 stop:522 length:192 start_codon:yes stop_codon:yes gene_type:complete